MTTFFLVVAASLGVVIISIVVWSFVRGENHANAKFIALAIIGFLLLSSPIWDKVVMKGFNFEFALDKNLRWNSGQQGQAYVSLAPFVLDKKISEELKVRGEELIKLGEVSNDQQSIEEILQRMSKATAAVAVVSKMAGTVPNVKWK